MYDTDKMCSMGQWEKPQNLNEVFSKLPLTEEPPSEKDIKTGYELYHAVVYCPAEMVSKLFRFVDQLLSNERTRTIIQTIMNLFQSGSITDKTSFTLAKQFYHVLASTLNLQYGNVLLATSTNSQLQDVIIRNDWPLFANNSDLVENCLQEYNCVGIQDIVQKLGIVFFSCYTYFLFTSLFCCRWQQHLASSVPPPSPSDT